LQVTSVKTYLARVGTRPARSRKPRQKRPGRYRLLPIQA